MMERVVEISESLYRGQVEQVRGLVEQAIASGSDPESILGDGLMAGMDRVGSDFKAGILFVPEVLLRARAMQAGMDVLRPHLARAKSAHAGTFLIGTVKGDLHDIGKNLVKIMLEGAGFVGSDLGTDVQPERFVAEVRQRHPEIVAMSALLTTTMGSMKDVIEALEDSGVRDQVKVIVGGAPVTSEFAAEIGADGYAPDAARAVDIARDLVRRLARRSS